MNFESALQTLDINTDYTDDELKKAYYRRFR